MKRFLCLLSLSILLLSACTPEGKAPETLDIVAMDHGQIDFWSTWHEGDDVYEKSLPLDTYEGDLYTLHIEGNLLDEEERQSLINQLDIATFVITNSFPDRFQAPTLTFVSELPYMAPICWHNQVYLSTDTVAGQDYLPWLVKASLDLRTTWSAVGISGILYNTPYDQARLVQSLDSLEDLSIVRLYDSRFNPAFNTAEEIQLANDLSLSLAHYVKETEGLQALLQAADNTKKHQWMQSLGIDREFIDNYAYLEDAFWYGPTLGYAFTASSKDISFYITPMDYSSGVTIDTAKALEDLIFLSTYNYYASRSFISALPSDLDDTIQSDQGFDFILAPPGQANVDLYGDRSFIFLEMSDETLLSNQVEVTWDMLPLQATYEGASSWSWFSMYLYIAYINSTYSYESQVLLDQFLGELEASSDAGDSLIQRQVTYFQGNDVSPERLTAQEYMKTYFNFRAYDALTHTYPENDLLNAMTIEELFLADLNDPELEHFPGFELTINQGVSFIHYLIKTYGQESTMAYIYSDLEFQSAFGHTYEAIKKQWLEAISPKP